ncbi:FUSC family protein [Myxococcaceae bacterium JPH2]|nr:FUSC family protein [Myxococcaceae bacterium JPH2]
MRHVLPRHVTHLFHLEAGRPALQAGLRAALALGVPLLVSALLHRPAAAWSGMAGLFVTLVDRGGPYRSRALAMGTLTLLGALGGLISAIPSPLWVDVVLTCCWVTACGFARCYGDTAGVVGILLANLFVVSLALPARGFEGALAQAVFFVLGGAWAMFLALVLWPLRPYLPIRRIIARCYRELAGYAEEVSRWPLEGVKPQSWTRESARRGAAIRQAMESARAALGAIRRRSQEQSGRGEHLLVLLEAADALFLRLTAFAEALDAAPHEARFRSIRAEAQGALAAFATDAQRLAGVLEEGVVPEPEGGTWDAEPVAQALRAREELGPMTESERAHGQHLVALLERLREYVAVALDVGTRLTRGEPLPERSELPFSRRRIAGPSWLAPLRDNLSPESVIFRHAIRLGLTAAVATGLCEWLGLNHGYWVTITVIVILQPYSGLTLQKGLQRLAGTLVGCALAAGLAYTVHHRVGLLVAVVCLIAVSVSLRPMNFTAYQVLLAPALVLLAEIQTGDWRLAGVRLLNTLFGGALALVSVRLLWPSPEHQRFPERVARVLRADRDYLRQVSSPRPSQGDVSLREARRRVGLALLAAEDSFQRLLGEWHGPPEQLEPAMALLTYARRFGAAVTALAARRDWHSDNDLAPLTRYASGALEDLAESLEDRREPRPLPPAHASPEGTDALSRTQEERLVRQLSVLHRAVERVPPELMTLGEGLRSARA